MLRLGPERGAGEGGGASSAKEARRARRGKSNENVIDIEAKPEITFDDFEKLQFQVGHIIACEEVKKSRKLLCCQSKDRKPGKTDCIRNQSKLQCTGNDWQKSNGTDEPKTSQTGRNPHRRNDPLRRRRERKPLPNDSGERNAGRSRNLLKSLSCEEYY